MPKPLIGRVRQLTYPLSLPAKSQTTQARRLLCFAASGATSQIPALAFVPLAALEWRNRGFTRPRQRQADTLDFV
jgi:hypothetical protein